MSRMQNHNLYNIKRHFQLKTGIRLLPVGKNGEAVFQEKAAPRRRLSKLALVAAIAALFIALTAFTATMFSTWAGDSLTMTAAYYGSGVVWVEIENQADIDLKLEPKVNLYRYSTQELVEPTGEAPFLDGLTIPANSTQKVRVDLRRTYDVEALEGTTNDFYYLQVTNDSFLLGQTWSCMVSFKVTDYVTPWYKFSDNRNLDGVLPSLRSYYQNFTPDIFARWADVFTYIELVQTQLDKVDGKVVKACDPPIYFDYYNWLGSTHWSTFDGYYKLLGIDDSEYYDMIGVDMPCVRDDGSYPGGGWIMPLFYLYQYKKADITSPKDLAFMAGNLLTFEELEPYKVYDDGEYVIYEMHHLFYTDLRSYVNDMLLQRDDAYLNEDIWNRIQRFYDYFSVPANMEKGFYNANDPGVHKKNDLITMPEVIALSKKGEAVSFEDIRQYRGSPDGLSIYESDTGMNCEIDGNYELFYAMHMDGTERGWFLIHHPSGESIDIRYEDAEAFVAAHDAPMPRCACKNTHEGDHGWMVTMDWLLAQGNTITMGQMHNNCQYLHEDKAQDLHYYTIPIYENEEYYLKFGWSEAKHEWVLWLVHAQTEDMCDLATDDSAAFVAAHSSREK